MDTIVLNNTIPFRAWSNRSLMLLLAGGAFVVPARAQPGVSLYTIPVVFHVLHQNGSENIADAQIADAIAILNAHYDAPTATIDPPFDAIAADMDIAFALASMDPDGDPTNGIDRIETPLTNGAGTYGTYLNPWPRNRYLNIWVVNSLATNNIAAQTMNPAQADPVPCTDGIMVYDEYVGSIGTGSLATMRTLTQMVGRFFDLKMLFEDPTGTGTCGDDEVADTPPCVPPTCLSGPNPCSDTPVNSGNFMYTPYASNMFTMGQRDRVHACLNSPIAQRNELASGNYIASPDCSTGMHAFHGPSLVLSPMPFHDRLLVSRLPHGRYHVEMRDASGRLVQNTSMLSGGPIGIHENLARGTYVISLYNEHFFATRSVVKE